MVEIKKITYTDNLRQGTDKINSNFETVVDEIKAVDDRVDTIIVGGGPDKDPELVDIRNLDPSYTPQRAINTAGDVTRDMQAQFMSHKAETVNWQRYELTSSTGRGKGGFYSDPLSGLLETGMYAVSNNSDAPFGITPAIVVVLSRTETQVMQMFVSLSGSAANINRIFIRRSGDGGATWSNWVELLNSSGVLTGALAQFTKSDNNGRMALSGGSLASASSGAHIIMEGKDYTGVDAGGNLRLLTAADGSFYFNGVRMFVRSGAPNGAVAAPVGSLYLRVDGVEGQTLYVKETGTGNTGWVAK